MTVNRAAIEYVLVRRTGRLMAACSLDGTTVAGTNLDMNDPIGYALRMVGLDVADITAVSNSDIGQMGSDVLDQFLDIAELRLLQNCLQNYDAVNITVGPRTEALSDIRSGLEKSIERKHQYNVEKYGAGATLAGGAISLDFQQRSDYPSIMVLPN